MALTLYGLTKALLLRHNGTVPSQASFDASVDKEVLAHKEFVNSSIQDLNSVQWDWPFNAITGSITCVTGTSKYAQPSDAKSIDWNTFVLQKDDSLSVNTVPLRYLDYHEYVDRLASRDGDAETTDFNTPSHVYRHLDGDIGISRRPDKTYEIQYIYYQFPTELTTEADIARIPDAFRNIILAGGSAYAERRRSNDVQAQDWDKKFENGVNKMRSILGNKYDRVRSGIVTRTGATSSFVKVST